MEAPDDFALPQLPQPLLAGPELLPMIGQIHADNYGVYGDLTSTPLHRPTSKVRRSHHDAVQEGRSPWTLRP
jgi:hypothetical protein